MFRILLFITLCAIIGKSHGKDLPEHIKYLLQYGHLETPEIGSAPLSFSDDEIESALKTAQKFGGIPVTGKLDNSTIKMLGDRRCGFPDTGSKVKRFMGFSKWEKRHLTYGYINYSPQLSHSQIENVFGKAFKTWARASGLQFSRVDSEMADIKIGFFEREHGDGNPFDGPGRVLAHAFFPGPDIGGDLHIDDDETWVLDGYQSEGLGTSLLCTVTHELGHSLGLSHSSVPGSIMNPRYTGQTFLGRDDILGIESLYGRA